MRQELQHALFVAGLIHYPPGHIQCTAPWLSV